MDKKQRKETAKHLEAFNMFSDLKHKNIEKPFAVIADEMGQKERTIYQWSCNFGWKERYEEWERKVAEEARKKLMAKIISKKESSLSFLMQYLDKMQEAMLTEKKGSYFVKDYAEVLKMFLLLTGEATERTENTNINNNTNKIGTEELKAVEDLASSIRSSIEVRAKLSEENT